MKYFVSHPEGPRIQSLDLKDNNAEYIGIVDSVVAEVDDDEVRGLIAKGYNVVPEERYFIPPLPVDNRVRAAGVFPAPELDPATAGSMQQMVVSGVEELISKGYTGKGVRIGIADTGVDASHPDLVDNFESFKDFVDKNNTTPIDDFGHGSACASIMLGKGIKVAKFHGVAPDAKFLMARVLGSDGSGYEADIVKGVDWLVQQKVDIINLSLGSSTTAYTTFSKALDNAVAQGIAVFVAAGNDGPGKICAPANALNAIAVASCNYKGEHSYFSSRGPAVGSDNKDLAKPDIMAWGEDVALAKSSQGVMGDAINEFYIYASGTSFATPFMSGCGALLKAVKKDLTPADMKALLMSTTYDRPVYEYNREGSGNVRMVAAMDKMNAGGTIPTPPPTTPTGCLSIFLGGFPLWR